MSVILTYREEQPGILYQLCWV